MVYVGHTCSGWMLGECRRLGFGEMTVRGELPPKRTPWAFDNGAFRDWRRGKPFASDLFRRSLERLSDMPEPPAFVVAPDVVAGGVQSLGCSLHWLPTLRKHTDAPVYLAVQDGMLEGDASCVIDEFQGVFVGGSPAWKIETGAAWVTWAHSLDRPCHIGRCGTANKVHWARRIGADSIDSCLPLRSADNLRRFVDALGEPPRGLPLLDGGLDQ